ncbi:MAG: PAS domain-containing protein, partial [Chromatiaceae bacterium]|nr:PAS domain-containing protein [Chromatiaceae bacterium]
MLNMKLAELNAGLILLASVCGGLIILLVAALLLGRYWRRTLQQRLGVYTSIIDTSPDALALVGPDYRYRIINQAFAQRAGQPREAIIGRLVPDVIGEQAFNDLIKPKLDLALGGNLVRYNAWFDLPATGRRLVLVTYAPYHQDPGRADADGVLLCSHDITDLRRIEQEQFTAKHALQALLDNSPMMACIKDPELRILSLNKRGEELLSVCADEVIGQRTEDVFPAQAAAKIAEHDRRILQTKEPQTTEDLLPTPNGERVMMSTRFPWLDSNHNVSAICTLSLDVTELQAGREAQRQAAALRESERRFRVMADGLPTMNWLLDAEGRVEYVNRGFAEYFGVTTAQMAMLGCSALVHPEDLSRVQARMASALK